MNQSILIAATLASSIVSIVLLIVAAISFKLQQNYRNRFKISVLNNKDSASYYIDSISRILKVRTGISAFITNFFYNGPEFEYLALVEKLEGFISVCVEETQYVFTGMTNSKCAVAIKIVKDSNSVYTLARDRISIAVRDQHNADVPSHPIDGNTDFSDIFYFGKKSFFSNDLTRLHGRGQYSNTSKKWRDHYNATCVVPIHYVPPDSDSGDIIGFLCVDTLDGKFEETLAVSYLSAVATVLSYAIGVMQDLEKSAASSAAAGDVDDDEAMKVNE
jgi:hypothetical protein